MKIRAKFKCLSVTSYDTGSEEVHLQPVTSGSDENKTWSKYTPSGSLKMVISADGAVGCIKAGREYYLDIVDAADQVGPQG